MHTSQGYDSPAQRITFHQKLDPNGLWSGISEKEKAVLEIGCSKIFEIPPKTYA